MPFGHENEPLSAILQMVKSDIVSPLNGLRMVSFLSTTLTKLWSLQEIIRRREEWGIYLLR